jgi:guanylate kinase
MGEGALFVISAPSGAGKSTLIERARPLFPDMLYSVSCTTRSPRNGEVHGIHYYFEDRDTFERMVKADELLEWKEVHGNLYGTPVAPVQRALREGRRMILDIDVQGARDVFNKVPQAVGIFVTVPDLSILEQRLRKRGTDSEESIRTRLINAPDEIRVGLTFHHVIVNDDLCKAVDALAIIVRKESKLRGLGRES